MDRKYLCRALGLAVVCVLLVGAGMASAATVIEMVAVGNAGNTADTRVMTTDGTTGYGRVDYAYNIGKYEVTAGQYTGFLNAVGGVDTYGLYNTNMSRTDVGSGITRSGGGSSGNPYTYSVATDFVNRPVNYVSFWDSSRFANWLNNGQQGPGTTETGAYSLNGVINPNNTSITRNTGPQWAVTSEDEWYKAAYYKGGGANAGYWMYPTRSNTAPGRDMADASGNNANYYSGTPIDSGKYTTIAGEFQNSGSPYGTFDQGGNVWEWNEAIINGSYRVLRGGSFSLGSLGTYYLRADGRYLPTDPTLENDTLGFRVSQVLATITVWNVDGTGSWGVAANWSGGIPNGPAATASFLDKLTAANAPAVVSLDGSKTVGRVIFDNVNSYNIVGSGDATLTLDNAGMRAEVRVLNGRHSIAAPIITVKDALISVAAASKLTTSRGFKAASNAAVTKEGEGIWDVSGGIGLGTGGGLDVNGGIVNTDNIRGGSLAIHSGGKVVLKQGGTGVSVLTGLTFDGTPGNWEGQLDLADNDLIVQADASTAQATLDRITNQIMAARGSKLGRWAGNGITSSAAAAANGGFTGLAAIRNTNRYGGTFFGFFDDQPIDANSILIKYTWNGDANLDGVINADDYFMIDSGFILQGKGYQSGDFNYDGVINADDYFLIDSSFIGQSGKLSIGGVRLSAVPEPSVLPVAVFAALGLATWRVRRQAR